jgi:hypothetical protein
MEIVGSYFRLHVSPKKEIESQLTPKIIKNSSPASAHTRLILIILLRFGRTVWCQFFVEKEKVAAKSRKIAFGNSGKSIITNKKRFLFIFLIFLCTVFLLFPKRDLIDDES